MRALSLVVSLCAAVAVAAMASPASAGIIQIASDDANSSSSLGSFTGSIDYSVSSGVGTLQISLTNTSAGGDGFLTAFAFNLNGTASLAITTSNGWTHLTNQSASPFGTFEFSTSTNGSFLGGGSPSAGLAVGQSATWVYAVTGSQAGSLTVDDFFSESSTGGSSSAVFLARFRGFDNGGSDKVPGLETAHAPLPPGVWVGAALLALVALHRLRQHRAAARA